jgi:hypothetical protein
MLLLTGGRERTAYQYADLLAQVVFALGRWRTISTASNRVRGLRGKAAGIRAASVSSQSSRIQFECTRRARR